MSERQSDTLTTWEVDRGKVKLGHWHSHDDRRYETRCAVRALLQSDSCLGCSLMLHGHQVADLRLNSNSVACCLSPWPHL